MTPLLVDEAPAHATCQLPSAPVLHEPANESYGEAATRIPKRFRNLHFNACLWT